MTGREWTIVVMSIAAGCLIVWDLYAAFILPQPNEVDTISGVTLGWSKRIWAVPYAFGVLGGHLFWPRAAGMLAPWPISMSLLLGSALLVALGGWWFRLRRHGWTWQGPILLVCGVLVGHMLWPQ